MLSFWSIITYISALPFGVIYWKLQADEEYGKMLWLKLVNSGSTLLAFYILMLLHQMTFENALLYNFLTNCLTSIVGIISKMGRLESVFHCKKEYIWNITHFGKFSLATSLSANFLRTSDTFIIAAMLNEE
ncbi:hypothetical protein EBZ39_16755, partial [bacterium]|nr:hypothetical protein [bacterium]